MKQTAVEFLIRELRIEDLAKSEQLSVVHHIINEALEMEKQQSFEFWQGGINCTEEGGKSFEQYYKETYNRNKQ